MHRTTAIAEQQQLRRLVFRQAISVRAYSSFHPKADKLENQATRPLHTTHRLNKSRDTSTIDVAYMPQEQLPTPIQNEIMRIPLLPNNYSPLRSSNHAQEETIQSVTRPEISTVSANGTHHESPSAMSEVVDNHAMDVDPFDLTNTVTNAAAKMTGVPAEKLKEPGVVQELWNGMLDDVFGSKKTGNA